MCTRSPVSAVLCIQHSALSARTWTHSRLQITLYGSLVLRCTIHLSEMHYMAAFCHVSGPLSGALHSFSLASLRHYQCHSFLLFRQHCVLPNLKLYSILSRHLFPIPLSHCLLCDLQLSCLSIEELPAEAAQNPCQSELQAIMTRHSALPASIRRGIMEH